jgi:hypothetical protein
MKKEIIQNQESLLNDIITKQLELHTNITDRSNFFVVVYTFLLGTIALKIFDKEFLNLNNFIRYSVICLGGISFICLLITIYAMIPRVSHKRYTKENIFYYGDFTKKYTREEYAKIIKEKLSSSDKLIDSYVSEIYELSKEVLSPTYNKINLSAKIFFIGLIISAILLIVGLISSL